MRNKAISILTLVSFVVFSFSCYSIRPIDPLKLSADSEIRKVEKNSGEIIEFNGNEPGRVSGSFITGTGMMARAIDLLEVPTADIQQKDFRQADKLYSVKLRDGQAFGWVTRIDEQGDKSILHVIRATVQRVFTSFNITISEVARAWIKQFDLGKTLLSIGIPILVIYGISWLAFISGALSWFRV
jgi:hypothetical protein